MPVSTEYGDTEWTTQDVADATGVCVTRATKTIRRFERRLMRLIDPTTALESGARPCDLAAMVTAVLETGGRLAAADRDRLRRRVRQLIESRCASGREG